MAEVVREQSNAGLLTELSAGGPPDEDSTGVIVSLVYFDVEAGPATGIPVGLPNGEPCGGKHSDNVNGQGFPGRDDMSRGVRREKSAANPFQKLTLRMSIPRP